MAVTTGTSFSGSSFTIKELTGDQREIVLTGRGMPYRPYSLKGKQNTQLTWLPGNPTATATVLGPVEEPSDVKGMWKDKYIGDPAATAGVGAPIQLNGNAVTTVREAIQLLDDVRRSAQLLEVTWDVQIRHGFLGEFEAIWQNIHDVEWSMHFDWISQGDPVGAAAVAADLSATDLQTKLLSRMSALSGAVYPPAVPASLDFLDAMTSAFQKFNAYVGDVSGATTNLATMAMSPLQASKMCIAACGNIIGTVGDVLTTIDAQVCSSYSMAIGGASSLATAGAFTTETALQIGLGGVGALAFNQSDSLTRRQAVAQVVTTGRSLDQDRLAMTERVQAYVYVRGIRSALLALRAVAIDGQATFSKQVSSTLLGVYRVKNGDDLRTISEQYYQTPYNWQLIAEFNELDTFELSPGQQLMIPLANTGEV